ncbi:MAG: YlbF family regulator [Peptococcaceae bacterium]
MNVHDLAHNLAQGLRNSPEYQNYQEALGKIRGNQEKEKILTELRKKQMEVQALQMMGQEVPPEKIKEIERTSEILNLQPGIREFLAAEYHLGKVLADIQKIIGEAVELWYPELK